MVAIQLLARHLQHTVVLAVYSGHLEVVQTRRDRKESAKEVLQHQSLALLVGQQTQIRLVLAILLTTERAAGLVRGKSEAQSLRLNDQAVAVAVAYRTRQKTFMAVVLERAALAHQGLCLLAALVVQPLLVEQERQGRSMGLLGLAVAVVALLSTPQVERVALDMLVAAAAVVVAYTERAAAAQLARAAQAALVI